MDRIAQRKHCKYVWIEPYAVSGFSFKIMVKLIDLFKKYQLSRCTRFYYHKKHIVGISFLQDNCLALEDAIMSYQYKKSKAKKSNEHIVANEWFVLPPFAGRPHKKTFLEDSLPPSFGWGLFYVVSENLLSELICVASVEVRHCPGSWADYTFYSFPVLTAIVALRKNLCNFSENSWQTDTIRV